MTRLQLPQELRAVELYQLLDTKYFQFADRLPDPLDKLARRKSTFLGAAEVGDFAGVAGLNPVLASTPWLFWELFSMLDDECFLEIAEAGMMFVLASIVLDHIVDGQAEPVQEVALFHQALYGHGVGLYRKVMPSISPFWEHFERLAQDHLTGLSTEWKAQSSPFQISLEDLFTMAHGKVSPIITTIAALAFASHQPDLLSPIETSLKHIAVASQLLDDVGDWEHDLEVGHNTFFLCQLITHEMREGGEKPSLEALQAVVEEGWQDVKHLRMVMEWLDDCLDAVRDLECPAWVEYVGGYRALTDENLTSVIGHHLIHKLRPLLDSQSQ